MFARIQCRERPIESDTHRRMHAALSETRNATVHGFVSTALARTASGYRLYWGVYVTPFPGSRDRI